MIIGTPEATLSIEIVRREPAETIFIARFRDAAFSGMLECSDYLVDSPVVFFETLARDWRGWEGERQWHDFEGRLKLTARADSTGHVTLSVEMDRNWPPGSLSGELTIEVGQLVQIVAEMRPLFPPHERNYR